MTSSLTTGRLAAAAAHTQAALAVHAPDLVTGFLDNLPRAADTVGRRLRGALAREGLTDDDAPGATRHAFHRIEFARSGVADPVDLLTGIDAPRFAAEIRNAVINLAVALARPGPAPGGDADEAAIAAERLAVTGHNLHPCGRTRLGWDTCDVLAHDLESGSTDIRFIAVRDDAHLGDDLSTHYPAIPRPPSGFRLQPVHAWQHDLVRHRYRDLFDAGVLRPADGHLDAVPTAALRTLLLPPAADGRRHYLKVSLDIQITSTRRSISVASTRNGPAVSALLHRLTTGEPTLLLMAETHGAAVPAGTGRDLSAIVRDGLTGRLHPGEEAIPGSALPHRLPGLLTRHGGGPAAWLRDYTRLLLPPLLRLAAHGVGIEAHLQNCLPTFLHGRPHRLALRDFAGLRLHLPRLAAAGHDVDLWPDSVVGTTDPAVMRAKLGYTAFQAHLGELVLHLDLDEPDAWRIIRDVVDETYDALDTPDARADHAALTAPTVPHKALVRMRLADNGDIYLPVENPLHG
ncbi:RhbF-like rhizobactin siderophore biosynthesis protein [Actinoplanes sp. SE50]|uniref:IucA/IucC family protein n=1 Tax=unclassified Actinoplanes TaxID=2626549 RepID=UPI00023EC498|nr:MULTISPECIES: IucA/IucC family protein [unclassified Actinoplanes]AEV85260.1 RhbF-like rhizobactin siderophore biosynthesis protein [Actinoplanes sp. SE50/110]ATO83655.1 RhbF-like rhizobactin siderophore biosynthesis protein [Actinoplanes sp. SE50]SLM01063.1 RhbF-like rhizobactin siderophore biosynthesis protein [Actinoplanes sp. SE50/110]